ncbi:MAG: DUF87 domain-containing protein [Gemmatimonadota bacterium]|nr:MAG: DUF87 domain-containing protein [Gemmatimonadota bacterium]
MARTKKQTDTKTYERLGAFYLGRTYDSETGTTTAESVLYDSKDLTTHAVCVGMTGSGKTGLCVSLLEEAAIDGIPAIVIDPKGDLGNLLLNFPRLQPSDFLPWVDPGQAARKGMSPEEYAADVAGLWKNGLAKWGQDGSRLRCLRDSADFTIYTPGSTAGIQLSLLGSFAAPGAALLEDADAFRERVNATASGLLSLVDVDADPVTSREHILLSNLFDRAWREGRDLDLASLIAEVQSPPLEKVGVMDLDTFYPSKDRFAFSMMLNNLLASPGFAAWMDGEPFDIGNLLRAPDGRPRISILSIAHLSDPERMFFVTLLLNEVVAWMRSQAGTGSLRALLYMDEVFGYFPPTANPPSKPPMLTLLKQARAYGLGVVLATQNPVDLDYKGLSNAGTWFLGRLQTARDKERVMDGLEGASAVSGAAFDRAEIEKVLSGLASRVFLMHNVHEDTPVLFHTRWAMSYLRGPLTRTQIQSLMADRRETMTAEVSAPLRPKAKPSNEGRVTAARPSVPDDVIQAFLPTAFAGNESSRLIYRPALLATADLHFANTRAGLDKWETVSYVAQLKGRAGVNVWNGAELLGTVEPDLVYEPEESAEFAKLPTSAAKKASYRSWQKAFKTHLYQSHSVDLLRCPKLKLKASPDEGEADFRVRVREAAHEKRDAALEKLRKRYAPKLATLQDRIRRAEEKVGREKSQYDQQKMQTAISVGATVLGALLGRKVASVGTVGRATTTARGIGRTAREKSDIARAKRDLDALHQKLLDLQSEFEQEINLLGEQMDPALFEITTTTVRPRKTDINVGNFCLAWLPHWLSEDGLAEPAYE